MTETRPMLQAHNTDEIAHVNVELPYSAEIIAEELESTRNGKKVNVVDGLFAIADALECISQSIDDHTSIVNGIAKALHDR